MNLLTARRIGSDFRYIVHLDPTKVVPDPNDAAKTIPDPAYVLDRIFGAGPRKPAETAPQYAARLTAYEASARAEMKALCVEAAAVAAAREAKPADLGTALAGEGSAF